MKKLAAVLVLLAALPATTSALTTDDLVAVAAMPLAVAAVSEIAGVPTAELMQVVSAMNRAAVPAPQFIEVVRYVPVALVEPAEPRFVTFVTTEVDRGVAGRQLAGTMADRIQTYGVREIDVVQPPVLRVAEHQYVPHSVVRHVEQRRVDPLALVTMPLVVAAVADLIGMPGNDLFNLVASLNRAAVPAPQFIEIVRYSPAVLVDPGLQPEFITFVDRSIDDGLAGLPLALAIDHRLRTYGIGDIHVMRPLQPVRVLQQDFIPTTVASRVAEVRGHPHGGPPGQLKRQLGVQTGAEIVHGTHPGRSASKGSSGPATRVVEERKSRPASAGGQKGRAREAREVRSQPATAKARPAQRAESGNRGKGRSTRVESPALPQPQTSAASEPRDEGRGRGGAQAGKSAEAPSHGSGADQRGGKGSGGKGKGKGGGL